MVNGICTASLTISGSNKTTQVSKTQNCVQDEDLKIKVQEPNLNVTIKCPDDSITQVVDGYNIQGNCTFKEGGGEPPPSSSLSTGAVIGITLGGVILLVLLLYKLKKIFH